MSGELTVGPPDHESVLETYEPTTITHRRGQSRFLEPQEEEDVDISDISNKYPDILWEHAYRGREDLTITID